MMRNKFRFSMVLLLLLLTATSLFSKEIPAKSNHLVNDYAGLLSSSDVNQLESRLVKYDEETSTQIAIVIIKSLDGDDLFDYSQRLAEKWGIGGGKNDNGVLLLVVSQEHQIRIHTGYGTEGAIPDAIAKRIIENEIKPEFKAGDFNAGLNAGIDAMEKALAGEYKGTPRKKEKKFPLGIIPFIIIFILFSIFGRRRGSTSYGSHGRSSYGGPFIGGFGGGSSGGFGGGGGGFGGFGGGGFGGGGASGSW